MKYKTLDNVDKAVKMIMEKGYDKEEAEHLADKCFAMVRWYGGNAEDYIKKLEVPTLTRKKKTIKYGWWQVNFDITLDGEDIRFEDLSEVSKEHIVNCILDGCRQGEVIEEIYEYEEEKNDEK